MAGLRDARRGPAAYARWCGSGRRRGLALPTGSRQGAGGHDGHRNRARTSPPAAMMGLISGYWVSQAVGVVAQLGVADQLGQGPRASDELARAVGADPQALYRVMRLLASLGVFAEVAPCSFGLTPLGDTLRSDAPGSVRNFAITE